MEKRRFPHTKNKEASVLPPKMANPLISLLSAQAKNNVYKANLVAKNADLRYSVVDMICTYENTKIREQMKEEIDI